MPNPIRVAFVDQQGHHAGGAEESLALLLRFLPPQVDPLAVFFEDGPFADRIRALGIDVVIHALPSRIKRSTREKPLVQSAMSVPPSAFELARILRRERVSLVYTNTLKAHVVGGFAARLAGLPCVSHLRDILDGPGLEAIRFVLRTCSTKRVAISQAVADCYALPKTEVISNPLDLAAYGSLPSRPEARASLGIAWDGPLVGMVGRINRWKGHDRFLRIARTVADRAPARFAIVGKALFRDEDFERELRTLVRNLDLEESVIFVPWLDDPRLAYAALDVLCNCSTREPFGRTTIEASAAGRPTICFDDGGAAEAIDRGVSGHAIPPGDERGFADAILGYIENAERLANAGDGARAHARRFGAELHAARVARTIALTP
jgi:glycosyltransferase involved in cell wall biosynthesis